MVRYDKSFPNVYNKGVRVWTLTLIALVKRIPRRSAVQLAFGMLLAGMSAAGAEAEKPILPGIGEHDHRVAVESDAPPWSAIGRVNRRVGGFCTGTVIGPRKALTVAHCLWSRRTKGWLPHQSLHFVAGYRRGHYLADADVTSYTVSPDYDPFAAPTALANLGSDWAVLSLDRDVGSIAGILPLVARDQSRGPSLVAGTKLIHAGYSQDKAHILTKHEGCTVLAAVNIHLFRHDCDATRGDSGSPLLLKEGGRYRLLAIHVASTTRDGRSVGLALLVPPDLPK